MALQKRKSKGRRPAKAGEQDRIRAQAFPGPDGPAGSNRCAANAKRIAILMVDLINRNWAAPDAAHVTQLLRGYDALTAPEKTQRGVLTIGGRQAELNDVWPSPAAPTPAGEQRAEVLSDEIKQAIHNAVHSAPAWSTRYKDKCILGKDRSGAPIYGGRERAREWQKTKELAVAIQAMGPFPDPVVWALWQYLILRLQSGVPVMGQLRLCSNDECVGMSLTPPAGPLFVTTGQNQWHCPACRAAHSVHSIRKRRHRARKRPA